MTLKEPKPPLYGLILTGGQSKRMGEDKAHLVYHQVPQYQYLFELLNPFCEAVFLSVKEFQTEIPSVYPQLIDKFEIQSPLNGIQSAFATHPHAAWLVVACDMPNIDADCLQFLAENRKTGAYASCFWNTERGHLEPLLSIWEPICLPKLKTYQGKSPLKFLLSIKPHLISPPKPHWLANINTLQEQKNWIKSS